MISQLLSWSHVCGARRRAAAPRVQSAAAITPLKVTGSGIFDVVCVALGSTWLPSSHAQVETQPDKAGAQNSLCVPWSAQSDAGTAVKQVFRPGRLAALLPFQEKRQGEDAETAGRGAGASPADHVNLDIFWITSLTCLLVVSCVLSL